MILNDIASVSEGLVQFWHYFVFL